MNLFMSHAFFSILFCQPNIKTALKYGRGTGTATQRPATAWKCLAMAHWQCIQGDCSTVREALRSRLLSSGVNGNYDDVFWSYVLLGENACRSNTRIVTYLLLGTALTWERLRRHPWQQPRPELPLPKLHDLAPRRSRLSSSPGSTVGGRWRPFHWGGWGPPSAWSSTFW